MQRFARPALALLAVNERNRHGFVLSRQRAAVLSPRRREARTGDVHVGDVAIAAGRLADV